MTVSRVVSTGLCAALLVGCGGFDREPIGGRDAGGSSNNNVNNNNTSVPDSGVPWNGMPSRNILVDFVLDGDTIIVSANDTIRTPDGRPMDGEKIRLIGVDAPEIAHPPEPEECWGDEAHDFTRDAIGGRIVTIDYDSTKCRPPNEVAGCRDDFNRLLGYVLIANEVHNENLVSSGSARVFRGARFEHQDSERYEDLESDARRANRGLWSCP